MKYEFFIAGRTRNKYNKYLKICELFDKYKISYYCFFKMKIIGNIVIKTKHQKKDNKNLIKKHNSFNEDLEVEKSSKNLLLFLRAGKTEHIEAVIVYRLGKNVMQ